jgi:predicted permease
MSPLRLAFRRLYAAPLFTVFAIATLALGIGVTTAAYTGMYVVGARPLGIRDDSGIVLLTRSNSVSGAGLAMVSWPDFQDLASPRRSFDAVVGWSRLQGVLAGPAASEVAAVEAVTGNYFAALGVAPLVGRLIQPGDDRQDAPAVIVLSEPSWRTQFSGDSGVIGTSVRFAHHSLEVIGVAPAGFRGIQDVMVGSRAGWVPLAHAPRLGRSQATFDPAARQRAWMFAAARLASGATVDAARTELTTISRTLDGSVPLPPQAIGAGARRQQFAQPRLWDLKSLRDQVSMLAGEATRLVVALPFLVLLVACTNIANLVLSRGSSRRQENAVRSSLGASRARLLGEGVIEAAVIGAAGGALGLLVAHGVLTWASAELREALQATQSGLPLHWRIEPVIFATTAAAMLLSVVVGGVIPAWRLSQVDVSRGLAAGGGVAAPPRWRGRSNLIALQVGISTAMFLLALVCVRFLVADRQAARETLMDLDQLALAAVPIDAQLYDEPATLERVAAIGADIRRLPAVTSVAASSDLPFQARAFFNWRFGLALAPEGQPFREPARLEPSPWVIAATPSFAETMNLRIVSGRFLRDDPNEAVLDEHAARLAFGSTDVVGRRVAMQWRSLSVAGAWSGRVSTVVGVTAPATRDRATAAFVYVPFALRDRHTAVIFSARTSAADATSLVSGLRTAVRRVDADLAVAAAGRGDVLAGVNAILLRFAATALGLLALLALALAMAGLYGVLTHVVDRRTREMGVRIALGAAPPGILRLVLRQGLRPVIEGLAIGLGAALVVRQLLQLSMTAPLSAIDAATFALAGLPLLAAGVLACYVPARRAARVDATVALKDF